MALELEEVILRCVEKHGDRYDYSKAVYVNTTTKFTVICKLHGEFLIEPRKHYSRGQGCAECSGNKKISLDTVLSRAEELYGEGNLDFSRTKYSKAAANMEFFCKTHRLSFVQSWNSLRGGTIVCKFCSGKVSDTETFTHKAKRIHGDKYDYRNSVWVSSKDLVRIICPVHGEFVQTSNSHISGSGCGKCAQNIALTTEEFTARAVLVSPQYDYSLVNYVNQSTKVDVVCSSHGVFSALPANIAKGHGCPSCAARGSAFIYIFKDTGKGTYKIGVSNDPDRRAKTISLASNGLFSFEVIYSKEFTDRNLGISIEKGIHRDLSDFKTFPSTYLSPFEGSTEIFNLTPEQVEEVKQYLESL